MATRVADRVLLDTNVLLTATDEGRSEHRRARAALEEWPADGTVLYTSGQILREYFCVCTRPLAQNGLGLARGDALTNTLALRAHLRALEETSRVLDVLVEIVEAIECAGKQVHDANVVATALAHGVGAIATLNVGDFARFGDRIRIIDLAST
jgi:predicted nucleic acid-binding protein